MPVPNACASSGRVPASIDLVETSTRVHGVLGVTGVWRDAVRGTRQPAPYGGPVIVPAAGGSHLAQSWAVCGGTPPTVWRPSPSTLPWGGDFLHALGHTLGTGLLVALMSVAGWVALHGRVAWASSWARAATLGAGLGCLMVVPSLAFAPESLSGLNLALNLHLPLAASAAAQGWALRGQVRHRGR